MLTGVLVILEGLGGLTGLGGRREGTRFGVGGVGGSERYFFGTVQKSATFERESAAKPK